MSHFAAQPIKGHVEAYAFFWDGQLRIDAGGAINSGSWGKGATYTKQTNGEYTLTLEAKYRVSQADNGTVTLGLVKAAAGVQGVEVKNADFSTGVIVFRFTETVTAGAGTDPAAAVRLNIHIHAYDGTLPKG
jgi:hypothetical protein